MEWTPPRSTTDEAIRAPSEERLLALCTARFNGWRYEDETEFDFRMILRALHHRPHLPPAPAELQALLFFLHRFLTDWSGEREPYDGAACQRCRALFLAGHDAPVPAACHDEAAK